MEFDKDGKLILPQKFTKIIKHDEDHDRVYKNRKLEDVRRQK